MKLRLIIALLGLLLPAAALAAGAGTGGSGATEGQGAVSLSAQVTNIYNFALLLGGLLAFGAIVYGAARYTLSAGSPSAQSDARDQITQALIGLTLLLGAYIVLNTINPSLTSFTLPALKEIKPPPDTSLRQPCPTCNADQVCIYQGNIPSCVSKNQPPTSDCDPLDPATCPAGQVCSLNMQTGQASCK